MGAWGTGPFENDDASDWVYEIEDGGLDAIHDVLDATVDIDAPGSEVGSAAVAAAELVAVIAGQPGPPLPDEVVALISDLGPVEPALVDAALAAVAHVRTEGELAELWAESDDHDAWLATLDDITRRLQAVR
jgi:hypothetical protein